ncbi:MAG: M28 family peptidase [Candidatus Eiseniibacteriota bacterium]
MRGTLLRHTPAAPALVALAVVALTAVTFMTVALPAGADDAAFLEAWRSIEAGDLARHIEVLASDAYEGREPGTEGEEKTLRYLEDAFRAAGAGPGSGESYLQRVPLTELRRNGPAAFSYRDRRGRTALAFEKDFVTLAGRPGHGTGFADLPLVFAGYGIVAPEYGWNDYGSLDLAGCAVLLLRGEPGSPDDSVLFRGRALTVHGMAQSKYEDAARRGARAAVVVHTDSSAGYPWSVMSGGALGTAQMFLAAGDRDPKLELVVHITETAARKLFERTGLDFDRAVAEARRPGFRARRTELSVSGTYASVRREIVSHNVIARIEGSGAPDECVIYTGHWDHVGKNDALPGDKIFNGAVDNATGTAALLELAQAFASLPSRPRRTVFLVATTAEEKGLLGSAYLAQNPPAPLERIVGVLNLDALFPFGPFNAMTVTGFGSSELEDVLAVAARRIDRVLQDDSSPEAGAYYRSDHYPFAKRGVPALFAVGGPRNEELTPESPLYERFADYMANGYHKPGDEYDAATWDLAGVEGDVRAYFETGFRLADDDRFPNWRYGNEFRALRDRMMRR